MDTLDILLDGRIEDAVDGRIGPARARPPRQSTPPSSPAPTFRGFDTRICTGSLLDGRIGQPLGGRTELPLNGHIH